MIEARTVPGHPLHCPLCDYDDYKVYRRMPAGCGRVTNVCRCSSCDGTFTFQEEKDGSPAAGEI